MPKAWSVYIGTVSLGGDAPLGRVEADTYEEALALADKTYHTYPGEALDVRGTDPERPGVVILSRLKDFRHDEETHSIPLGAVVRYTPDEYGITLDVLKGTSGEEVVTKIEGPVVLIVVAHNRDCDGTPLYFLASAPIGPPPQIDLRYGMVVHYRLQGISESPALADTGARVTIRPWADYINDLLG